MARRVLTVSTINEMLAQGSTELRLDPGDIVTALAREHAQQYGFRLVPAAPGATPSAAMPAAKPADRTTVRKAVIAALGSEPDGLDAIISRIMS